MRNTVEHASADPVRQLLTKGWCVIQDALAPDILSNLDADLAPVFARTPYGKGNFYGGTTKRFGRILTRSVHAAALVQHRHIIDIARELLLPHCDCIQLNVGQAIGIAPGAPAQAPHRDQDMWRGPKGEIEYLVNVMWPLTPFREENGATIIWPESHAAAALRADPPQPSIVESVDPGSALIFLGSTLHAAGANRSDSVRRGIVIGYSLGWLKPYENPWLAYPPLIARAFSPELAALVGYRQHRPNLGNYEGQCPSILLADSVPPYPGAIDALRPDQQEMVDHFARSQAAYR